MGSDAIQEWQRGVVAIGTRNPNLPESALVGTGFIVDLQSGLIVTCAHVALDAYKAHTQSPASRMDPGVAGVAIGVGIGEDVTWVCRAELRYISRPPDGHTGPDPPHHWVVKDHGARLDLAVLQLVELDGSTLRRKPGEVLARGGRTARALSLGVPPSTPRSVPLSDGAELVMLGYGQSGSGKGAEQTSTTMRGHYTGCYSSNGVVPGSLQSGDWLKVDVRILSGHSGGPVVNRVGEVVGWAVMSSASLGQLRPITSLVPALTSVLKQPCCNTPTGAPRDVTGGLRAVLREGAIEPGDFQLGNDELQRCHDSARRAEQSAQDAHLSAQNAHLHEQGAYAHALFAARNRDDAAGQAEAAGGAAQRAEGGAGHAVAALSTMQTQLQVQAQLQAANAQVDAGAARLRERNAQQALGLLSGGHGQRLALQEPDSHGVSLAVAASTAPLLGPSGVGAAAAMMRPPLDGAALQGDDNKRQRFRSLSQDVAGLSLTAPLLDRVPHLPEEYTPRPELEAAHRDALLRTTHTMAITATTTGVSGPAGAGKSTTAAVLARDPLVHAHFPDGITWLSFGRDRTGADVLRTLATFVLRLDPALPHEELPREISAALVGQRRLLVLDDIWTKEQLHAFSSLAAEGGLLGRLVTTRSNELAGEHAESVGALQEDEGLRVLASYMGTAAEQLQDGDANKLVDMCSGNPAMLRSVAALCKKKGAAHTRTYLKQCRQKMRHAKLPDAGEQYGTLFDALTGSLDHLRPGLAKRCAMLATFPEDTDVPWSVVGQLWGTDALETEEAVTELESWHLIDVEWDKCALSLIDLHLDYLRVRAKDDLARWHAALLRGCGRRKLGTDEGTADDAYWGRSCGGLPSSSGQHHLHHLRGCGWEPTALGGELTHLAFGGGQRLGDECVKALSEAIKVSGSLTTLWLNGNHLGPEGGVALAEALKVNRSLTDLDISGNPICEHNEVEGTYSVDGINAVCDALRVSGPLTSLNLGHCGIGAEGGVAVAEALRGNSSLTRLSLHANCIGTQVGVAIAEALKVNGSLTYLNIHSNDTIGDTGAGGPGCQRLVEVAGFAIWP